MIRKKLLLLLFVVAGCCAQVSAQTDGYACDFEDAGELDNWTWNSGRPGLTENVWVVGDAVNNGGEKSLYISADGGKSAGYVKSANTVISYRILELKAGEYELSFDWQAGGYQNFGKNDAMYVCWIPEGSADVDSKATEALPNWIEQQALEFNVLKAGKNTTSKPLYSSTWQSSYTTITTDGSRYMLVFAWNNSAVGGVNPGACVDNINIIPSSSCQRPSNVTIVPDGTDVVISWDGLADSYDVRCKSSNDAEWQEFNVTAKTLRVSGMNEGLIDVYIRSNCGDLHSGWQYSNKFVFFPGTRCIDYLQIGTDNCSYGSLKDGRWNHGITDNGYADSTSRHTIHYSRMETDPRTNNGLKTVPDDEVASVRLGNWCTGSQMDRIEYKFTVDAKENAILLLKYACVLQDPDHDDANQPRFTLDVLGEDGKSVSMDGQHCASVDFIAGVTTSDDPNDKWNLITKPLDGGETDKIYWKDWTTVGINLDRFDGEELTVQVTSYDCAEGAHYGYAYFAISCDGGQITTLGCSSDPYVTYVAPEGFDYKWYRKDDTEKAEILSDSISLTRPADDMTVYVCDVIQKTNPDCYFTLEAINEPRFPLIDAKLAHRMENCQNIVKCESNDTRIVIVKDNGSDTVTTEEVCDSVVWVFGDPDNGGYRTTEWAPEYVFPDNVSGRVPVTLTAYLAACEEVETFMFDLPALDIHRDTVHEVMCDGVPFVWRGEEYSTPGLFSDTLQSTVTMCDSIKFLDLVASNSDTVRFDTTICSGDLPYVLNGKEFWSSGLCSDTLSTYMGCDSVVLVNLTVNESLVIDMTNEFNVCADAGELDIPIDIRSGMISAYDLTFENSDAASMETADEPVENSQVVIAIPDDLKPNRYKGRIVFQNLECGNDTADIIINVSYPDSLLMQRWNDVIGIRNSSYNGGYTFESYQWYKDGEPIDGQTGANLYLPDGLDFGAQYNAKVRRADDQVEAFICPIVPEEFPESGIEVVPTVSFTGGTVQISSKGAAAGTARLWTMTGMLVESIPLADSVTDFSAPDVPGTYILEIRMDDGYTRTEKLIVRE